MLLTLHIAVDFLSKLICLLAAQSVVLPVKVVLKSLEGAVLYFSSHRYFLLPMLPAVSQHSFSAIGKAVDYCRCDDRHLFRKKFFKSLT